jgi:hypothetical protein
MFRFLVPFNNILQQRLIQFVHCFSLSSPSVTYYIIRNTDHIMAEVTENKPEFASEFQEFETRDVGYEKRQRTARVIESVRFAATLLALLAGLTILGTSADTLGVYNKTSLGQEFFISLWPAEFDIRPTTALVICSTIIFVASAISLVIMKVSAVSSQHPPCAQPN